MLHRLLELLDSIPGAVVLVAACLLPAAETALMIGLLIPGELIVVAAGIRAANGDLPVAAVAAAAVVGAIAGDSLGYLFGRHFRKAISRRLSAKRRSKAEEWLKRRGQPAIFLARFTPFLRSVMPAAAGAATIRYRSFLLWSAPAGILWGTGSALLGYYAARNSEVVLQWTTAVTLALIAGLVAGAWLLQKKRNKRRRSRAAHRASAR
jgi:membrane-associated protein